MYYHEKNYFSRQPKHTFVNIYFMPPILLRKKCIFMSCILNTKRDQICKSNLMEQMDKFQWPLKKSQNTEKHFHNSIIWWSSTLVSFYLWTLSSWYDLQIMFTNGDLLTSRYVCVCNVVLHYQIYRPLDVRSKLWNDLGLAFVVYMDITHSHTQFLR